MTETDLKSLLKDPSLLAERAYVSGDWTEGDNGTFEVTNPARGDVIAHVADLSRAQVARAVAEAEAAQKEWAKWTGKERAAVLRKWFDLMMENQHDLGIILTAEQGKPLAEAKGEIAYGASFVEFFAEEAKRVYGETIPGHQRDKRITVIKQPIGVAASITPWNFPNAMITRKAGPALAAGCWRPAAPSWAGRLPRRRCRRRSWGFWPKGRVSPRGCSTSSRRRARPRSARNSARTRPCAS
jgi:succinate-semialdehyde dehydrogenase/glutarate-semialdehyde dehydrogenase